MKELIAIFIGGGAGSMLRYGVQVFLHERITAYHFPWATFTVNIVGSFLIGMFYAVSVRYNLSVEVRLMLTTGLCGGFTTYSTFSNDVMLLLRSGHVYPAVIYIVLSLLLGVGACFLGYKILQS